MRRLVAFASVIVLLATLFHAGPQQAWACSCELGPKADEVYLHRYLRFSDAVIVGEVESWDPTTPDTGVTTHAVVRVQHTYKGFVPGRIDVYSEDDEAGCGYEDALRSGGQHLLSLRLDEENRLRASFCSSWRMPAERPIGERDQNMQAFLAALGREANQGPPWWQIVAALAAGSFVLGGIVAVSMRRAHGRSER